MQTGLMEASAIERRTMRKVVWRLIPFLMMCYLLAFIDRGNVGMASLQMNQDLGMSAQVFGFGSSLFFISYFFFEVPSNLALQKYGARIWIARIMITWGIVSAATALVHNATTFYVLRFLLGAAEAGFFPGVLLYLSYWIPAQYRARIVATFMVAIPAASFIGSPISALLLQMDGVWGLRGWHWLFILEGMPTVLLGIACLFVLTNKPDNASWLDADERAWLSGALAAGHKTHKKVPSLPLTQLFRNRYVLCLALVDTCASAAGSTLSVWQPQLLKSFGLTVMQTGLLNSVPYAAASILMVYWGRHSDRVGERRWHTVVPMLLIGVGLFATSLSGSLLPTVCMLCAVLVGAYSFKGPFWALATDMLSNSTVAAGLATVNAIANLLGGGLMVNVYGWVKSATGSYALALMPLAILTLVSVATLLLLTRNHSAGKLVGKTEAI
ncbi:MFS transporter permease [Burkholderia multivorans]|uniref:MFS transporter n=1 Tax=Burkholderia multivorans TaxID=87883 RepID=UPI000756D594|nr:MFS transporter [Burkholderia multivorans]KVP18079.1 MFS transporter permease [Burkholderia multivorans]MBJ9939277.1 MFS transporter [Burkholderia multivorans]MBU9285103.1 MFS transporter [Burkholderia multivorans]